MCIYTYIEREMCICIYTHTYIEREMCMFTTLSCQSFAPAATLSTVGAVPGAVSSNIFAQTACRAGDEALSKHGLAVRLDPRVVS